MTDKLIIQFSTTFAWQSHLIRIMCNSPFSHCDLVLPEGLLGASDPGGVTIRSFNYEPFKIKQQAVITTDKADAIIARVKSQIGKPFDDGALHAFLHAPSDTNIMRNWRDLSSWFCAELIGWSCEIEKFWPYEILTPENRLTPPNLLLLLNPYMDLPYWHSSKIETTQP